MHIFRALTETLRRNMTSRQVSVSPFLVKLPRRIRENIAHFLCSGGIGDPSPIGYRHDIPGVNYQLGRPLPRCTVSWV